MRVLVACEKSQEVCKAFRERGHEAYSCDIQDCSGGHPEWHIKGDVLPILNGHCEFVTSGGGRTTIDKWDLIIAHPPCTYLSNLGANHLYMGDETICRPEGLFPYDEFRLMNEARIRKGIKARDFFIAMLNAPCEKVAVENPVPSSLWELPPATQCVQPYMFGEPYKKKTYLWLKGLPQLVASELVEPTGLWVDGGHGKTTRMRTFGFRDAKKRSKTFPGIARAMAEQWG